MTKNPFSHGQPAWLKPTTRPTLRKSSGSGQKEECLVPSYSHILFPGGTGAHAGEGQKDTQGVSAGVFRFWWGFIVVGGGF